MVFVRRRDPGEAFPGPRGQFAGNRTSVGMHKMRFDGKALRFGRAVQKPALVQRSAVLEGMNRKRRLPPGVAWPGFRRATGGRGVAERL